MEEAPELELDRGRGAEELDDAHLALGEAVLPFVLDPVGRVALGVPVHLGDRVELLARAAPPLLGVGEPQLLPPCLRAREHPRPARAEPVVDRREEPVRLLGVGQPDAQVRRRVVLEREPPRIGLRHETGHRRAVAEAAVDRRLRGPERRQRLAPAVDVFELAPHEVAQDPAATVRRQDADPGDAGARELPARDREIERVCRREPDRLVAVVRRERARRGQDLPLALPVVVLELGAERPLRGLHRRPQLVLDRRPDLDRHAPIRSGRSSRSGA